jgi:drug/metabolite transporter (DMT)-like permease|tara:strand:+ start:8735 stop:9628 length:894 start_codon:yes stop_codon:yes gene_type:complete
MNKRLLAHLALFGANLIYGINYTVAKDVMPDYIEPLGFILVRVTGAVIMFWLCYVLFYYEKVKANDLLKLAICGLFGVAINQMLFFEGLNLTTPINAAVIMVSNPILVLLFGVFFATEGFSTKKGIGVALGAIGALTLITNGGQLSLNNEHFWGNIMVFLNASSYAVYLVLVKPLMKKYKPITVISWVFLFGIIFVIPFGWSDFQAIQWSAMPSTILWSVVFVVVGTTFLAYLFNIYGLKTLNPSTVSTYIYLQPVLASIVAIIASSDELNLIKVISAILIFLGVYLVSQKTKPAQD